MEFVLDRAREFLGATCDPQLRLVSRRCRDALAAVPREELRVEDFLSSASLFVWARKKLRMPQGRVAVKAALGGHLAVLKWLKKVKGRTPCPLDLWTHSIAAQHGHIGLLYALQSYHHCGSDTCAAAARGGHVDVLQWLRSHDPPCPWDAVTSHAAAATGHLELQWMRAQDPPCPWDEGACANAAAEGQLNVLKWLRAQEKQLNEGPDFDFAAEEKQWEVLEWLETNFPF
ncbi:hypothetical protein B484DRAFT_325782 [Ochromonadaceae sp. CCMP2298]|nr:hypothetical protein B484DRAFT_325782 [Ochromonadaceae sp. CCMP2298]